MSIEKSINIACSTQHIFDIYKDVDSWAIWDPDIEAVGMDGDFVAGSTGWLKPVGAPRTKTTMTEVNEPSSFCVQAKLPLCTLRFEHELTPHEDHTTATHRVLFSGLLAPIFSRIVGSKIRKGIDGTMNGLKHYAESLTESADNQNA